jgi:hypothetical protein
MIVVVLALNMACMAINFASAFDRVMAVDFVQVENDVLIVVIKLLKIDKSVVIRRIEDRIRIGSPLADCD